MYRLWVRERTEVKRAEGKKGRSAFDERGRTCVGSFARANVQRPQAKEAEKQRKGRGTAELTKKGKLGLCIEVNGPLLKYTKA